MCRGGVFAHLSTSPVEKETIIPGIEMLGKKILKVGYTVIGKDTKWIDEKTHFLKTLHEIQYAQKVSVCTDSLWFEQQITQLTHIVESMSYEDISRRGFDIYNDISLLQRRLMAECR